MAKVGARPSCGVRQSVTLTALAVAFLSPLLLPLPAGKLENVGAQGNPSVGPHILAISAVVFHLLRLLSGPISRFQSSSPSRALTCRGVGQHAIQTMCYREIPHSSVGNLTQSTPSSILFDEMNYTRDRQLHYPSTCPGVQVRTCTNIAVHL
jgi:hypothetical protein